MQRLILLLLISISGFIVKAQNDSIEYETYDLVYLTKGGALKGEILSFNEFNGVMIFRDTHGRKYTLSNEEYEFFEENKRFKVKNKNKIINPRKDSGFEVNVGLSFSYLNTSDDFSPSNYYLSSFGSQADIPLSLKVGIGKYLNPKSVAGITAEYALITQNEKYFNIGFRYSFIYSPQKNSSFYFPVELKYAGMNLNAQYDVNDTVFYSPTDWSFPDRIDQEISLNSIELNVGQGISFALKNKKSLSLEIMLLKQFVLSQSFSSVKNGSPNSDFIINGVKLSALFNF